MTPEQVRAAPKVLLHDHLDGGLRPATVVELAGAAGHALPTTDPEALGRWFRAAADSGSLPRYLEAFRHTVAVLQTPEALVRAARECAQDLADDGVVYAEVRFAPELHACGPAAAVEAVLEGFRQGCADRPLRVGALLTALRDGSSSLEVARLAVRSAGVVGFDLAGAEEGHPPAEHLAAFRTVHGAGLHCTVHAGEGSGLPSIREALQQCHAERLGHGVRIADDLRVRPDGSAQARAAGRVRPRPARAARAVPDQQRPHRRRRLGRGPPRRPAAPAALPGHGEHGQPAHERGVAELGAVGARGRVRLRAGRAAAAHRQRGRRARSCRTTSGCSSSRTCSYQDGRSATVPRGRRRGWSDDGWAGSDIRARCSSTVARRSAR